MTPMICLRVMTDTSTDTGSTSKLEEIMVPMFSLWPALFVEPQQNQLKRPS